MTFKNKTTKVTTRKSYRCYVLAAKENTDNDDTEVVEEALAISAVSQTASNAFTLTFNKDASGEVTKDNLTIKSEDGSVELVVKSVEFSTDGTAAKVTVYGNFTDGTTYNVTYDTLEGSFNASVGEVTGVVINTTSAQQNVATPIEFSLYDANGIDVTPSIAIDSYTYVSISGNYATADIGTPSTAKITLDTVGAEVTVTVTYDKNTTDSTAISATATIVCVDATAITGTKLFAVTTTINNESECAKFYLGLSDTSATIGVDGTKTIYLCATDDDGEVISYDSYEVESSNDNIVSAYVDGSHNKFVVIKATGNGVGTAQLTVTATKNGKDSYYTVPVTTYKADVATKMTVSVTRTSMSNAVDDDYNSVISATLYDAAGYVVEGNFTAECKTTATTPAELNTTTATTSSDGNAYFTVKAENATAKTYVFEITGSDNANNSSTFTKRVSITVKALPDELTNLSYQIEVSSSTIDVAGKYANTQFAKLYATCNNLFAGYVRYSDDSYTIGSTGNVEPAESEATIDGIESAAYFGTLTFGDGNLVVTGDTDDGHTVSESSTIVGYTFKTVNANDSGEVIALSGDNLAKVDDSNYYGIARVGSYTIKFKLTDSNEKTTTKSAGITVTNSYTQPTVKVLSTKVDTLEAASIIDDGNLSTNVDMNNDTSSHQSITDLADSDYVTATSNDAGTKMVVKYALVIDNIATADNADGYYTWTFYVPINTTFVQN